ncbi:twin-arginine translocase TatA/TatE family subunit [Alicyclobacillus curvatus]|nr:twin-arginine translocase TatA/TatE family subunit [Alicyclobacillus curvatus]
MNFGNIGLTGFLLILIVLLVFWGPSKLPEIGKSFGRSIKEFKNATNGILEETEVTKPQASTGPEVKSNLHEDEKVKP